MTSEPGSAAMERTFDDLVFEYGGLCYDEGHEKRNHDTADGDAARLYHEILSAFAVLTRERDEAREANRKLHRRVQVAEAVSQSAEDYLKVWLTIFDPNPARFRERHYIQYILRDMRARIANLAARTALSKEPTP